MMNRALVMLLMLEQDMDRLRVSLEILEERKKIILEWIEADKLPPLPQPRSSVK